MNSKNETKLGDFVVLPNGRVGRWSLTDAADRAVVVSGPDVFRVKPAELRPAF